MQMDKLKNEIDSLVSGLVKRNDGDTNGSKIKEQPSSKSSKRSKVSGASSSRQSTRR